MENTANQPHVFEMTVPRRRPPENRKEITVDKTKYKIRYANETETQVTIIIEEKEPHKG